MITPQTLLQDRYLVTRQIGQGGMGAVYIATDQRFGSTVALKETFFTDVSLRKAFEREARLLNRLRHPALPRVSDHFIEDEGQFLVMEFITGEDLSEMLKQQGGAFPLKEVLGWADQLLDALDYLHTQESPVIHRDIKPQNLKLTPRGQIILLDFGLAKGTPLQLSQATASASVYGYSRNYAPIEQIQGTGTDPRSDLYSLAATLYHLMTGMTPPDALTRAADVLNGQSDPLRPANEVNLQVNTAVAQVLMRAMSQNAGHRPQTAAAMRDELREAGKETQMAGHVTNAQAIAAGTILEQDTELMGTQRVGNETSARAFEAEPASISADEVTTDANAAPATNVDAPAQRTKVGREKSEITEVNAASTAKRQIPGRAVGIAAGVVILVLVAAVVYAMTRRSTTPSANTQGPTQVANPSTNNSQVGQPNESENTGTDNAVPQNSQGTATRKPDASHSLTQSNSATDKRGDLPTVPATPAPPKDDSQTNTNTTVNRRDAADANLNDQRTAEEERQAKLMRRRAAAEQQRSEYLRRQAELRARRARRRRI